MSGIDESNGIFCNVSVREEYHPVLILFGTCGTISTAVCLVSVVLLVFFRMWKNLTNRIMLSLSVAISLFSFSIMIQLIGVQASYWNGEHYSLCTIKSFLVQYAIWVMLLSTLIVTFHLCVMTHFQNLYDQYFSNNKYIEMFYHIFPWTFPVLIVWIPFTTNSYGVSGPWCWIKVFNDDCSLNTASVVQVYALWYGELILALIFNTIVLLSIVVTLFKRYCQKDEQTDKYRKAFNQTLPLIGFSVTFQFFSFIALANRVTQTAIGGRYVQWIFYLHAVAAPAWGFFGGLFIIIYIIATGKFSSQNIKKALIKWHLKKMTEKNKQENQEMNAMQRQMDPNDHLTQYVEECTVTAFTEYDIPSESIVDDDYKH